MLFIVPECEISREKSMNGNALAGMSVGEAIWDTSRGEESRSWHVDQSLALDEAAGSIDAKPTSFDSFRT